MRLLKWLSKPDRWLLPYRKRKQITTISIKEMQLSISAPGMVKYKDTNWTPPELWDHGIAGAFLDYNLYAHYAPHQGDNSKYKFLWAGWG